MCYFLGVKIHNRARKVAGLLVFSEWGIDSNRLSQENGPDMIYRLNTYLTLYALFSCSDALITPTKRYLKGIAG